MIIQEYWWAAPWRSHGPEHTETGHLQSLHLDLGAAEAGRSDPLVPEMQVALLEPGTGPAGEDAGPEVATRLTTDASHTREAPTRRNSRGRYGPFPARSNRNPTANFANYCEFAEYFSSWRNWR
jgi:hypothetical protein